MKNNILIAGLATVVIVALLFAGLVFLLVHQQQNSLYRELLAGRNISLNHLINDSVMPLLDDDARSLNSILKVVKTEDGTVYGMILDHKDVTRAHTDVSRLGSKFNGLENIKDRRREGETIYVTYLLPSGLEILDISAPVVFMQRELGRVHIGISTNFIKDRLAEVRTKLLRTLLFWGSLILVVLIVGNILIGLWLLRWDRMPTLKGANKWSLWAPGMARFQGPRTEEGAGGDTNGSHIRYERDGDRAARNQVTVLFAGIRGFKAYAQTREPTNLIEDLNEYVSVATDCIVRHGGYIDKSLGDAVIAVFAGSFGDPNHAKKAVDAALEMQRVFHDRLRTGNKLLSLVGIGLSSGIVLSGAIGPDAKKELTFLGESFKIAYSLNLLAGPGEIVVSRDAYQLLKNLISVEPLPPREMMQRTKSWESFRLIDKKKDKEA